MSEKSYNGWTASRVPADFGGLEPVAVAGEPFAPGVRAGDVAAVFRHLAGQLHGRVEPVVAAGWHQADDWGYSYRPNVNNPSTLSCHASGTAIDYNATRHPNGKRGTFTTAQVREIRRILGELGGLVTWGGDFTGTTDEMHWEISGTPSELAALATRLRAPAVPSSVPAPLREGDTGARVAKLQGWLNRMYPSYSAIDLGAQRYGPQTVKVIAEFQRRSGITGPDADGTVVGPRTWAKLLEAGFRP